MKEETKLDAKIVFLSYFLDLQISSDSVVYSFLSHFSVARFMGT